MDSIVKTVTILFAATLLCCCVNEIEWHRDDNGPCLAMNAQLSAGDSLHCVYLAISRYESVSSINDGTVKCYVNGRLEAEAVRMDGDDESYFRDDRFIPLLPGRNPGRMHQGRFVFKASFKPGDTVRIEGTANGGKYSVWAEITVPAAPECSITDTTTATVGNGFPVTKVRVRGRDISNGKEFYRLTAGVSSDAEAVTGDGQGNWIRVPYSFAEESVQIDKGNDPVLCDGTPASDMDLLGAAQNIFLVFSDHLFNGGTFELGFSIDAMDVAIPHRMIESRCDSLIVESVLHVHVCGITEVQYNYLKALSIYEYNEGDITLTEPVSFPDNVEGGVGIVSIAVPGECSVTFSRRYHDAWDLFVPLT